MSRRLAALALIALVLAGAPAAARAPERSPFQFSLAAELPALGAGLLLWLVPSRIANRLPSGQCDPCSSDSLNFLDRPVTHFRSEAADLASDVMVVAIPVMAAGACLLDLPRWGWRGVGEDYLLMLEAATLGGALQQLTAWAVGRPRPYMYRAGEEPDRDRRYSFNSFFSGHTTSAFAVTASFATIRMLRRPRSDLTPLIWIAGLLIAASVPVSRVASGEHFWSDVLVGAGVGTAAGILVPVLHRRSRSVGWRLPFWIAGGPGGAALRGDF